VDRRFILGLGHQKCGTTWLYEYLKKSSKFDGGKAKEYHIWDALDTPILKRHKATISLKNKIGFGRSSINYLRHRMQNDPEIYFDYFQSLYSKNVMITGDITPSYSGLSIERINHINEGFCDRGITVLPVVFIRNPLSRIKSAVRFNLDRKNYNEGISYGESNFESALCEYYKSENCKLRTKYMKIIENAWEVFGEGKVYVGVYENMFEPNMVEKLSLFLGVEPMIDFAKVRVNQTRSTISKTNLDDEIMDYYSSVYSYCSSEFPETASLWS
jgi:hypothetical protein